MRDFEPQCEILIDPNPTPRPRPLPIHTPKNTREVHFVDSGKPNSRRILDDVGRRLEARGVKITGLTKKARITRRESDHTLERIAEEQGLLILGVFD
ncbi:MAG: hypothetical protein RMA76_23610 [Deltaproteobacteria bacterium]|jgi:hypothetical protein